jgi:hypothetical protein
MGELWMESQFPLGDDGQLDALEYRHCSVDRGCLSNVVFNELSSVPVV